jgi:hypothetical protein
MAIIVISNFIIHSLTSTTKFGLAVVILFMMYQFSLILHHDLMQAFNMLFTTYPEAPTSVGQGPLYKVISLCSQVQFDTMLSAHYWPIDSKTGNV